MLMEWLEPMIKLQVNETQIEADEETRTQSNRLKQIIRRMIERNPSDSMQAMEIDELVNEIITATVDFTYRRCFCDCSKLFKIDNI